MNEKRFINKPIIYDGKVIGEMIYKDNDFLPYHWISENRRLEFYSILESDEYKNLPEEFQLLRKSKDLFLNSLTIKND